MRIMLTYLIELKPLSLFVLKMSLFNITVLYLSLKQNHCPLKIFTLCFSQCHKQSLFHTFSRLTPQFLTVCPYTPQSPKKAANTISESCILFWPVPLFLWKKKNLKNRQASVIYYLWWLSWTAAGACNKDVVIHHKESVDS